MTTATETQQPIITTVIEGGYLKCRDQIVRNCGGIVTVDQWERHGSTEVAVFNGDERYLYAIDGPVTIIGHYPERAV